MVAAGPGRPCVGREQFLGRLDRGAQLGGVERSVQQHHVEREMEFVVVAVERGVCVRVEHVGLAEQHTRWVVAVGDRAPASEDVVHLRSVRVVDESLPVHLDVPVVVGSGGWIVAEFGILQHGMADVDAKARDTAVVPEAVDAIEFVADAVVPPVEVGLGREELVQVVLPRCRVECPGTRARIERVDPVVRRTTVRGRIGPDVVVAVLARTVVASVDEPGVPVARVVGDEVEHDRDAAFLKHRTHHMNEYYMDLKKYVDGFNEVA